MTHWSQPSHQGILTTADVSLHFLVLIIRLTNTDDSINYILYYMPVDIIAL